MTAKEKYDFRKRINTAVFLAAVSVIVSLLCSLGFYYIGKRITVIPPLRMGISTLLSMSVPLLINKALVKKDKAFADLRCNDTCSKADKAFFIASGIFICMSLNFLTSFLKGDILSDSSSGYDILQWILMFLFAGILPAVMEEMLFRECILAGIKNCGGWFAVIFSSLLFASIHNGNINMLFAFLAGIVIGYIRIRTGSLLCCIAVHLANNLLTLTAAASAELISAQFQSVFFYATGTVSIVFTLLLLPFAVKKIKRLSPPPYSLSDTFRSAAGAALVPVYLLSIIIIKL